MIYDTRYINDYVHSLAQCKKYIKDLYGSDNDQWLNGMARIMQTEEIERYEHFISKIENL